MCKVVSDLIIHCAKQLAVAEPYPFKDNAARLVQNPVECLRFADACMKEDGWRMITPDDIEVKLNAQVRISGYEGSTLGRLSKSVPKIFQFGVTCAAHADLIVLPGPYTTAPCFPLRKVFSFRLSAGRSLGSINRSIDARLANL